MSWRRLDSLLRHLPRESWFVRQFHGESVAWTLQDHLLALVVDALQIGNWQFASAHSKSAVTKPKRLPRPGVDDDNEQKQLAGPAIPLVDLRHILDTWSDDEEAVSAHGS